LGRPERRPRPQRGQDTPFPADVKTGPARDRTSGPELTGPRPWLPL